MPFESIKEDKLDCKLANKELIKPCKLNSIILITSANRIEDLDLISNSINIHFNYIIVCFNEANQMIDYNKYKTLIIILMETFDKCVNLSMNMGFKQQSFIISRFISNFEFWNYKTFSFEKLTSEESVQHLNFKDNLYLIRKTVANGIRQLKFILNNKRISLCNIYESKNEDKICNPIIESINNLNWHSNDLVHEYCQNLDVKTVWIPDYHDGPRVDISSTLIHLGQKPILAGHKLTRSPYPETLKLSKITTKLSSLILQHTQIHLNELGEKLTKENYEYYKNNEEFNQVDAVICSFPSSMCEGFMPLNQTLIFNPAKMYNLVRSTTKKHWLKLNENLNILNSKSKLIVSATSKYDEEYQFHFTGFKGFRLYAFGGYYAKDVLFKPIRRSILVGPGNRLGEHGHKLLKDLLKYSRQISSGFEFKLVRSLYKRYSLNQLANHRAIVIIPYATQCYSVIDFYISNIPLIAPSLDFLSKWRTLSDRTLAHYYGPNVPLIEPNINSFHKFDPNKEQDEDYRYWAKFADFYEWPFVTTFDSWEDLFFKLNTIDFKNISNKMKKFNSIREADLLNNWCQILRNIKKTNIPKTYDEAKAYFNVTSFQI